MNTIFLTFFAGLVVSLALTPLARQLGIRFGAMDVPDSRKMHDVPTPRLGGVAIFAATLIAISLLVSLSTSLARQLVFDQKLVLFLVGALLCFLLGVIDDFRPLGARVKLGVQIVAATIAFSGGTWIGMGYFESLGWVGALLSYATTVFWFLLFINAVNLIDGLDGLAGGVCFFVTMVMMAITLMTGSFVIAMFFAALSGSVLGFLRYNFNPASIFLGDGGSYFLGFAIAGLSILGNVKEQTGVAILIPLIAMGVPLFDTLLSTVRRFLRGRGIFSADNRHIHHRLVAMGLTTRRAVLLVYGMTILLCVAALILVQWQDARVGFVLAALGAGAIVLTRRLGYFEVIGLAQFRNWVDDLTHASGLSRHRRELLDMQIEIRKSRSLEELWPRVVQLLERIEFDHARLYRVDAGLQAQERCSAGDVPRNGDAKARAASAPVCSMADNWRPACSWDSRRDGLPEQETRAGKGLDPAGLFYRVELPIVCEGSGRVVGLLVLSKNHNLGTIGTQTLLSIEYLRRILGEVLERLPAHGVKLDEVSSEGAGI